MSTTDTTSSLHAIGGDDDPAKKRVRTLLDALSDSELEAIESAIADQQAVSVFGYVGDARVVVDGMMLKSEYSFSFSVLFDHRNSGAGKDEVDGLTVKLR